MQTSYQVALLLGMGLPLYFEMVPKLWWLYYFWLVVFSFQIIKYYVALELDSATNFLIIFGVFLISAFFMCRNNTYNQTTYQITGCLMKKLLTIILSTLPLLAHADLPLTVDDLLAEAVSYR